MSVPRIGLDDYRALVGQTVGTSNWVALDQVRINQFAAVTEDRQFIHIDPEAASHTPFGGTIAHGFLSLSMLSAMAETGLPKIASAMMEINYGFNRVRFLKPVLSGKRVRAVFTLLNLEQRAPGQLLSTVGVNLEIEGETTPAAIADWLVMTIL
ncbi:MaoC family dehydratase [Sphingobium sp. JS3065]|jgi:acyl dehydratase|uniref:MaoC family dehydratase n=1 Tax=Sphingobium sp. JS3065 TaxID=2970925 RepID=UPI0022641F7B|nr:MaoC family dehydratase [Sphingobium sp. JS3065]UZW56439.1 MaoC family dehydratase [Sphingobium sp. JS3065]